MSLRIRQVKPAFWTDGKIGRLPVPTRLFYIGTWMLADDAGWFEWCPEEIGASLYPFDAVRSRERRIVTMGTELVDIGSLVVYECGHASVPHLIEHQRLAGPTKRVETVYRRHLADCPASPRGFPLVPASHAPEVRSGKERSGTVREPAVRAGLREIVKETTDPETGKTTYVSAVAS